MRKLQLSLLLAVLMSMVCTEASADYYNVEIDGIYYNFYTSAHTAEVTYKDRLNNTIAYYGSITIPQSVTYQGTTYRVTSIGYAFEGCSGLTSVTIPNSVTKIGSSAFSGCSGLTSVTVKNGNSVYDSRNNCNAIIETVSNTLVAGCKNTIIPNSVTSIGEFAFYGCSGLTSVTIPNSVTSIGNGAFKECSDLTSITIGNGVTSIDKLTFEGCSGLTSITIPNSVTSIGERAFSSCSNLTSVDIPNSMTSIGNSAFSGCKGLTSITIPNSVTSIGERAFNDCSGLTSITVKSGNTVYDSRNNCNAIIKTASNTLVAGCKNTVIPNSVTSIGKYAFADCTGLTSITIPNSVTSIDSWAFQGCSGLTSITIPNSVTFIGDVAFNGCKGLTSVTIPNSVTSIGEQAFWDCTGLTSITIPNSVTSIGKRAFGFCKSLTSVKGLHTGISIGSEAFGNTPFEKTNYKNSYDYLANSYIIPKIKEWQKKRDFETTAQYRERVTKENQQRKIKELTDEYVKIYTGEHRLNVTLGAYDADYQMYALNSNYGTKYVKVPLDKAPAFKENFGKATFQADYVATADGLKLSDLEIKLKRQTYHAEKNAVELAENTIDMDLPDIDLSVGNALQNPVVAQKPTVTVDRTIDQNIPTNTVNNKQTFAIIIGNERYTQVAQVPFAQNDAKIFAEYCKKTLGLPAKNVKVYENATYGTMIGAVSDIQKIAKAFKGDINVIFYYAGHGIPDEATGDGYLLPIDADGLNIEVCYSLNKLYKQLGEMQAKSVTCFMDACFSGAQRGSGMVVAARGVAIKAKNDHPSGNTVVFTAATDKQTAYPYEEKGHGMFTYYLLKKLCDTKGDCTLGELGSYICDEVAKQAVVTNGKEQTPVVLTSAGVTDSWRTMKLK